MSATKTARELASPDSRRRPPHPADDEAPRAPREQLAIGVRAAGGRDSPSSRPTTSAHAQARTTDHARDVLGVTSSAPSAPAPADSGRSGR